MRVAKMASPTMEFTRSPFQNVFQILPQGHDKALKQAFYNTAATLFVVAVCGASVAVYYILEAFLRPLLWAILCGTFLHPFKNTLTWLVQGWLKRLRTSGTPLLVGTMLLPFEVVDQGSEVVGSFVFGKMKAIIAFSLGLPVIYLLYYFGPLKYMFGLLQSALTFIYHALGYFSAIWVWTVVVGYVLVVIFYWTPGSRNVLRQLALPVWCVLLFHLATIAGYFRVPMVIGLVVLLLVGFVTEINQARKKSQQGSTEPSSPSHIAFTAMWKVFYSSSDSEASDSSTPAENVGADSDAAPTSQEEGSSEGHTDTTQDKTETVPETMAKSSTSGPSKERPKTLGTTKPSPPHSLSYHCFMGLLYASVLVRIWKNLWVLQLLPLLLLLLFIKGLGRQIFTWKMLREKAHNLHEKLTQDHRIDILAPKPVRGLVKLLLQGDHKIVRILEQSMDQAMSILIIIILLVGAVLLTFFMAVQVHRESVHLVSVTSNVLNNSMHPELGEWLPDNEDMQVALDSMVGNAYLYGREWIASKTYSLDHAEEWNVYRWMSASMFKTKDSHAAENKVLTLWDSMYEAWQKRGMQGAFNGDSDNESKIQEQVLQVWDRMYETWFARNATADMGSIVSVEESGSISLANISSMWAMVQKSDYNSLNIVAFVKEHIGVVMSVLESVWLVLKGNLNLALSVLTAMLSLLLGGGTAILNFLLSAVVFLTTLFYLLASSGDTYKPMELVMSLTPAGGGGGKFGKAVEEAIGSVFMASLKMSLFYGLYTWLTHSIFCINIVFIPSMLAAVFAAIPFVGTYFAAVPAIIELWLVNGEPTQAGLLLAAHMLPSYFVDTAIYSEIKGGHPYLTGLAIAGGMYWMGLEGAIMGPIILCCLIVAVNVYTTMLQPEAGISSTPTVILDYAAHVFNLQPHNGVQAGHVLHHHVKDGRKKRVKFQRAYSEDLGCR